MIINKLLSRLAIFLLLPCICITLNAKEGVYRSPSTDAPPVIDGMDADACWQSASWASISNVWIGSKVSATDYSGKFKAVWTASKIYVLMQFTDDSLRAQPVFDVNNIYNYDCVEIFIDENMSRGIYTGTYGAFAYHMDTTGHICYARGNFGWEQYTDHIVMKVKKIAPHVYNWEFELTVYNDTYDMAAANAAVTLTVGKTMGWSVAYNDNDMGTTRQNMFGSKYIAGADKNVSYYNASVFGDIQLVLPADTGETVSVAGGLKPEKPSGLTCFLDHNQLCVSVDAAFGETFKVTVIDMLGKPVMNFNLIGAAMKRCNMDGSASLKPGTYFVKAAGSKKMYTSKIQYLKVQ